MRRVKHPGSGLPSVTVGTCSGSRPGVRLLSLRTLVADWSRELRELIYTRDNWQCQACGVSVKAMRWRSIQHRKARGQGGESVAENGVTVCGSATSPGCHRRCENRDAEMVARGFVVWSWQDPAEVPVERWDGQVVLLLPDGGVRYSWQAGDEK